MMSSSGLAAAALTIQPAGRGVAGPGGRGVAHRPWRDGEVLPPGELGAVLPGPLLVAEHGDAARGEPPGEVAERLVLLHRLVAGVGPGAVDQHHRGEGALPHRYR